MRDLLIGALDNLVDGLELLDDLDRPEDLLLADLHVVCHVTEDSWLDEESLVSPLGSSRPWGLG